MERLTERASVENRPGIWVKEGFAKDGLKTFFDCYEEGFAAINKLAEYEDLELEPEQIVDMDVLYRRKCEEVARLQGFALVAENDRLRRRNASLEIQIKKLEEQLRAKEST